MQKTPLEDFTTEILAAILTDNREIGDAFVNQVLKIEGKQFTFSTQECHNSLNPDHPNCRVDLVIRTDEMICFVEHKVEAREGYIQLDRYAGVLDQLSLTKNTYLRYCTKYYDEKTRADHAFRQFRWAEVYKFLLPFQASGLIKDYLEFLNAHDMSDEMDFSLTDLLTMQGLNPVIKKMERYLEKLRQVFGKYFDIAKIRDSQNLKQIRGSSRFIFHAENIFGDHHHSELGVGFDFADVPELKVWIWVNDKNSRKKEFQEAIKTSVHSNNGDNWMGMYTPLSDFISAENAEEKIEAWFAAQFVAVKQFIEKHPELDWHI